MKRCPFCGGQGELMDICSLMKDGHDVTSWAIYCTKCPCRTKEAKTPEEAIKNWDTRIEDEMAKYIVSWSNERIVSFEAHDKARAFLNGEMTNSILHDVLVKEFGA